MANFYEKTRGGGAKEGLEKKMKYWENKDYQYELGVTIGACMNLAVAHPIEGLDTRDSALVYFQLSLSLKQDADFLIAFNEYYENKNKVPTETVVNIK